MSDGQSESRVSRRPLYAERLLPLLYRRISLGYYRRSQRFARHRKRVGEGATLPVPALVDVLAVYLSQRLPAPLAARLGVSGLLRTARLLHALLTVVEFFVHVALRILRRAWQPIRRRRARGRQPATASALAPQAQREGVTGAGA